MDCTAKLWDLETGKTTLNLSGHKEEVISISFSSEGDRLITGSFDKTAKVWDLRTGILYYLIKIKGECILTMDEHTQEISNALFDFTGELAATSSLDHSVKLWDLGSGKIIQSFNQHKDEVLDIMFNSTGTSLASCSADATARIYSVSEGTNIGVLSCLLYTSPSPRDRG